MTLLASSCSLSEVLSSGRNVKVAMIRVIWVPPERSIRVLDLGEMPKKGEKGKARYLQESKHRYIQPATDILGNQGW